MIMMTEILTFVSSNLLIGLLVVSLAIFGWSAINSKTIKGFQFQLSVCIMIWILGEIVEILISKNVVKIEGFEDLGMEIHLVAMILFCMMIWLRFYYSKIKGARMVEKTTDFYND